MVNKNKNHFEIITDAIADKAPEIAARIGMTAMVAATFAATTEAAVHEGHRLAAIIQPHAVYVAAENAELNPNPEMRRSSNKEEIHHTSATYGAVRRSPAVSGAM